MAEIYRFGAAAGIVGSLLQTSGKSYIWLRWTVISRPTQPFILTGSIEYQPARLG